MAKVTVLFGVLLILLGGVSFVLTGSKFPTSLIPVAFGILLVTFGSMAETPDSRRRMLFMHIAVTVGLGSTEAWISTGRRLNWRSSRARTPREFFGHDMQKGERPSDRAGEAGSSLSRAAARRG